jgi:hypothetical protein
MTFESEAAGKFAGGLAAVAASNKAEADLACLHSLLRRACNQPGPEWHDPDALRALEARRLEATAVLREIEARLRRSPSSPSGESPEDGRLLEDLLNRARRFHDAVSFSADDRRAMVRVGQLAKLVHRRTSNFDVENYRPAVFLVRFGKALLKIPSRGHEPSCGSVKDAAEVVQRMTTGTALAYVPQERWRKALEKPLTRPGRGRPKRGSVAIDDVLGELLGRQKTGSSTVQAAANARRKAKAYQQKWLSI